MKKTLRKRVAQLQQSVLPRISVEALESRTLLSAGHGHDDGGLGWGLRTGAIHAEANSPGVLQFTISDAVPIDLMGPADPTIAPPASTPWRLDGHGNAVLAGTIIELSADGGTTTQDVAVIVTTDGSSASTNDSKDKTGGNSGTGPKTTHNNGSGGTANPNLAHATPGGTGGDGGTSGPQAGTPGTPTGQPVTPTPGPTLQDPGSVTPNIARPTPQPPAETSGNAPAVTPLAMTPTGSIGLRAQANGLPGSASSNIPNLPGSVAPSTSATFVAQPSPAVHELSHTSEHPFSMLAAITPPLGILASISSGQSAAPIQISTGTVHVSDVASADTSPDVYIIAAAPSLPARIAYNFVRLDAAVFQDTAWAFAAELAALNVTSTSQSHTRAWAITAGVLSADLALLIYWHRQSKRRKQQESQPAA